MSQNNSTPRLLLLGALGQLGSELRRSLSPSFELVCTALTAEPGVEALDMTDFDAVRARIRAVQPAVIVNATAYTAVDQAEKEPELAQAVNGAAPGVLQEEANRIGAAVVHYSTDYVFDGSGTRPWSETDAPAPLSVYGRTKLAGEQSMASAGGAHLILRSSWIFGATGVNFVKKILKLAQDREKLRVIDDQVGGPTSAAYLAELTASILAEARGDFAGLFRERGGVFHAANAGFVSWHGLTQAAVAAAREAGLVLKVGEIEPIPSSEYPTPARRPLNSRLNCARLAREYRHTAPTWQEALAAELPAMLAAEFGLAS